MALLVLPMGDAMTALTIDCALCGLGMNILVEEDGLRKDGEPPLSGGQGILKVYGSKEGEDPIEYKDFIETVIGWKEDLEEVVKKGVIPREKLKELIKKMGEALEGGMDTVDRGDGELTVEVQPFGHS